ncbi:hypothetical protein NECID01_0409 [Nematocida sp. AWRm77]|nr:hypothetical protein NECID01_0409 [Nematocida sp. AWRm77]
MKQISFLQVIAFVLFIGYAVSSVSKEAATNPPSVMKQKKTVTFSPKLESVRLYEKDQERSPMRSTRSIKRKVGMRPLASSSSIYTPKSSQTESNLYAQENSKLKLKSTTTMFLLAGLILFGAVCVVGYTIPLNEMPVEETVSNLIVQTGIAEDSLSKLIVDNASAGGSADKVLIKRAAAVELLDKDTSQAASIVLNKLFEHVRYTSTLQDAFTSLELKKTLGALTSETIRSMEYISALEKQGETSITENAKSLVEFLEYRASNLDIYEGLITDKWAAALKLFYGKQELTYIVKCLQGIATYMNDIAFEVIRVKDLKTEKEISDFLNTENRYVLYILENMYKLSLGLTTYRINPATNEAYSQLIQTLSYGENSSESILKDWHKSTRKSLLPVDSKEELDKVLETIIGMYKKIDGLKYKFMSGLLKNKEVLEAIQEIQYL